MAAMRWLPLFLALALPSWAQDPGASLVRVELSGDDLTATHVQIRNVGGVLHELEVPETCTDPCVLREWVTLPDGDIWATGSNEHGISVPSNTQRGEAYLTLYERADVNGDGRPSVADLLTVNRMIFSEPPE
jgi:hypothetical protein